MDFDVLFAGVAVSVVAGAADEIVQRAGDAQARQDWGAAYYLMSALDVSERDDAQTLEALADAAWWLGKMDECIAARERAYARFEADGDARGAARPAILL